MSKVPAHWELIGEVARMRNALAPDTLLVGNGDVADYAHGVELATAYSLDGIMIGRGIFQNPFAFAIDGARQWEAYDRDARIALYRQHVELFAQTWQHGERNIKTLNRFCKIYINGFDGAKELREQLMSAQDITKLQQLLAGA